MYNVRYLLIGLLLYAMPLAARAADEATIVGKASRSVVILEYTLKSDKGETRGWGWFRDADELLREERPLEIEAFLVKPDTAVGLCLGIHPRFIEKIQARHDQDIVEARIVGYGVENNTVYVKFAKPLPNTQPLKFDPAAEPAYDLFYNLQETGWVASLSPYSATYSADEYGNSYYQRNNCGLALAEDGTPVAVTLTDRLPTDGSWKGSPLKRRSISAEEMQAKLSALETKLDNSLLRVRLNFRSPKKSSDPYEYYGEDNLENATEMNVAGLVLDSQRLLVLAHLKPKVTTRLERITAFTGDGQEVKAEFEASLKEYGAFLAKTETKLAQPIQFSPREIADVYDEMLLSADVRMQGEQRVLYYEPASIHSYMIGYKRKVFPDMRSDFSEHFIFDLDQRLLAFPATIREKATVSSRWSDPDYVHLPVAYLEEAMQNISDSIDPGNIPLTEEEENRIAWLGVELQALDRELAQLSKVSHLTNDGQTGAMVSYVYPDSPAEKAGVQPGDILIRLHIEGQPKPLEVEIDEYAFAQQGFPWSEYDQIPEMYYDRIPAPWPLVSNSLNEKLTEIGFGKKMTADFFRDGELIKKEFAITESPKYYASAARCEIEELGLTVRDLTYEVRRYFQKQKDEPGVIASKVEQGSKASVAGLKPYEIITHVNAQPVMNVKDFERLVNENDVLRLSVKRMNTGRVVQIIKKKTKEPTAETDSDEAPTVGEPATGLDQQ